MSAGRDLALWLREHLAVLCSEGAVDTETRDRLFSEGLDLVQAAVLEEVPGQKQPEKSLADRAFDMWMVMASSGEYRVGPSGRDIVRTARDMMAEVTSPTPWPERKSPQADGFPAPGWNPPPEDELARY